jgi:hypothetical protein
MTAGAVPVPQSARATTVAVVSAAPTIQQQAVQSAPA